MDFLVPKLSATMDSARVLRWLKQPGEKIAMGEALVELETDKAAMEVESPIDGTLDMVIAGEGSELPIGGLLARLKASGDSAPAIAARLPAAKPAAATSTTGATPPAGAPAVPPVPWVPAMPAGAATRVLASPLARRLAREHGLDLSGLSGTGPQGRIRKRDVAAAAEGRGMHPMASRTATPPAGGVEPLSPMRGQIAQAVALSRRTIPSFVLDRWVETTALERARVRLGPEIERAAGIKPTLTDFLLQALADSFGAHLALLDRWHEDGGGAGRIRATTVDIGLVVAVPDGVMIPALRDLRGKTLAAIAELRQAAVQRARAGRLVQSDSAPMAFSLSNIGKGGADRFEAIINPGQSCILAVGRLRDTVIARGGEVAVAQGVNLTLSVDHRLIDGLAGAEFLETLARRIERGPWGLD